MSEAILHAPFEKEIAFYESICSGDLELVKMLKTPLCSEGYGTLSKNRLRNLRYHLIISISMITRYCINYGMTPEEAYNLSDSFIMKADECKYEEELNDLHFEMISCFTKKMGRVKIGNICSKQIIKAVYYINCHINEKITMRNISDHVSLSVSYFSRLFKEEVGYNVSDYITMKKIETASRMFKYSTQSTSEISCLLNFSSQSYFIKVFKKYTGMTPKEYRSKYNFFNKKDGSM